MTIFRKLIIVDELNKEYLEDTVINLKLVRS